jgi:diguanylate cyclase (GGDEF)-like protein/PAS domain S-box-containing protein
VPPRTAPPSTVDALDELLRGCPRAVVAALGPDGTVPFPAAIDVHGHTVYDAPGGIELFPPEEQIAILDVWGRRDDEPILSAPTHLLADPLRSVTLHVFDVREQHGIHILVLEGADADLLARSAALRPPAGRGAAHVTRDAMGVFLAVDDATTDLLGWPREALIGRRSTEILHPDDAERAVEAWLAMRVRGGTARQRVRLCHADGHHLWIEVTNHCDLDDPAAPVVRSELIDISDEMAHLAALQDRERQLARLAEALPVGICHLRSDGQALYANEPFRRLLGTVAHRHDLVASVVHADRGRVAVMLDHALAGLPGELEVGVLRDGSERRCEITLRPLLAAGEADEPAGPSDGRGPDSADEQDGVIVCVSDVTDRARLRAELEHQATHDALSGCLNRGAAVAALERALLTSPCVAVAFIDLDGFKAVNDELGHAAGDELLRIVAARLKSVTRGDDEIGRIGGDEFVVVCPQGNGPFPERELTERLATALNADVLFAGRRLSFRASIGVAISEPGEVDAEALLTRADAAMYRAKRQLV